MGAWRAGMLRAQGQRARIAPGCRFVDHALTKQALEGLIDAVQAEVAHGFRPEPCIDEVHLGVLDASTIEIHVHPTRRHTSINGEVGVVGIGVAQEVPRGIHEGVHGVGFSLGWPLALRARGLDKGRSTGQRVARPGETHVPRKHHGKLVIRDR